MSTRRKARPAARSNSLRRSDTWRRRHSSSSPTVATTFHFSYARFLENRLRDEFGFFGTPVRIPVRSGGQKGRDFRRVGRSPVTASAKSLTRSKRPKRPGSKGSHGAKGSKVSRSSKSSRPPKTSTDFKDAKGSQGAKRKGTRGAKRSTQPKRS